MHRSLSIPAIILYYFFWPFSSGQLCWIKTADSIRISLYFEGYSAATEVKAKHGSLLPSSS
ncbi:hypothetical protein GOC73_27820 [Sinorhizobium medicae]|nr:hypothetical protein [Sinorhizobium medicae]MDX0691729.1 hypothetical protein [Sinorhizobium medicae]